MRRTLCLLSLIVIGGCTRAVAVNKPNPTVVQAGDYDRVFRSTVQSLRDMGFVVDRQEHRFGLVSTDPLSSPTMVEVWRDSNTTLAQAAQSTINFDRRVVKVTLTPDAQSVRQVQQVDLSQVTFARIEVAVRDIDTDLANPDAQTVRQFERYLLAVEVMIERQQRPTRRLTGSKSGRNVFGTLRGVPEEWDRRGITANYWLPVARDLPLEQRILHEILDAIAGNG